jgi:pilus assembly protein Flp/PilA
MMSTIVSGVKTFISDENGVTAIEYGLIAALIGVAIAAIVGQVGDQMVLMFRDVVTKLGGTPT